MAGNDETTMAEIVATLASGYQSQHDRLNCVEEIFSESIIVPGKWIIPILVSLVLIVFMLCVTFGYCFMAGY